MKLLLLGSFPHYKKLAPEFTKYGINVTHASPKKLKERFNLFDGKSFDLIYFTNKSAELLSLIREVMTITKSEVPIIVGAHGAVWIKHHRSLPLGLITRSYNMMSMARLLYYKSLRKVHIHLLNSFEYEMCKRIFGHRAHYAPLSVPVNEYSLNSISGKFEKFTVLFYALRYQKGVDLLLHVATEIFRQNENIRFVILGSDPQEKYVRRLISRYPKKVIHIKHISSSSMKKLLSKVHVYLNLSRYETFGVLMLECLAAGTPVVTFDIPGVAQDVLKIHGVGYIVKPFNLSDVTKSVSAIYNLWRKYPKAYESHCFNCKKVAKKMDSLIVADYWTKMFKEVINNV
jgi:glycosyltransferase involved in cell wall biosynthesis